MPTAMMVLPGSTEAFGEDVRFEWRLVAQLRMSIPNITINEIANQVGFNYHTVRNWLHNPAYQRYETWLIKKEMKELPPSMIPSGKTVQERISDYAVDMIERLNSICEQTKDEKLAASIAQDFLDRAGHAPKTKQSERAIQINIGTDVLEVFLQRAREAQLIGDGNTIEQGN